jgi:hypothetical protein
MAYPFTVEFKARFLTLSRVPLVLVHIEQPTSPVLYYAIFYWTIFRIAGIMSESRERKWVSPGI